MAGPRGAVRGGSSGPAVVVARGVGGFHAYLRSNCFKMASIDQFESLSLNDPCLASLRGSRYSVVPRSSLLTLFPRDCARKKDAVSFGFHDLISGDS